MEDRRVKFDFLHQEFFSTQSVQTGAGISSPIPLTLGVLSSGINGTWHESGNLCTTCIYWRQ